MIPLLRLLGFLQGSVGALVLSLVLLLASTVLLLIQPILIEYAIDSGIETGEVSAVIWGAVGIVLIAEPSNLHSAYDQALDMGHAKASHSLHEFFELYINEFIGI